MSMVVQLGACSGPAVSAFPLGLVCWFRPSDQRMCIACCNRLGANNSFKPTPHRGVNSVLCATLHAVATPPWGGLTPALGGRKAFDCFAFKCSLPRLRLTLLFGQIVSTLLLRSGPSGALTHCMRCVVRLRKRCLARSAFPQLTRSLR